MTSDNVETSSRQTVELLVEIRDGLFTNWKFGFVFDPRLYDLQLLVIELFYFVLWFFMEN